MNNLAQKSSRVSSIHDKRDWEPYTWDKRGEKKTGESEKLYLAKAARSGLVTTNLRSIKPIDEIIKTKKIENEEETFKHEKVSLSISKRIAKARNEKKCHKKILQI